MCPSANRVTCLASIRDFSWHGHSATLPTPRVPLHHLRAGTVAGPLAVEGSGVAAAAQRIWLDPARSVAARVEALLRVMTTDQKVRQLGSDATTGAVPSLGVPSFIWQYECLHGKEGRARAGELRLHGRVPSLKPSLPPASASASLCSTPDNPRPCILLPLPTGMKNM